jgi:hypothetical protein
LQTSLSKSQYTTPFRVEQRRGLQSVAKTFAVHIGLGQAVQFLVNERNQFFQGELIPIAPGKE